MRDYVIYDMYTDDRMFRYEVYKHPNGMYEVCVQSREAEDFAVNEQYLYCDIPEEVTHFTDTLERAIEIGDCKLCQMQALSPDRFYLYKILYCRLFHPVFWRFGFVDIVAVAVDCNYARKIFNLISANSLCA